MKTKMKTAQDYVESLRGLELEVYVLGERVENVSEHPILRPSLNALARPYDVAHEPDQAGLLPSSGKRMRLKRRASSARRV